MAQPDHLETEPHPSQDRKALLNRWRQLDYVDPDKMRHDTDQIIGPNTFDWLVDVAEDAEDRRELAAALAEDDFVPWEEVKADLGLSDPTHDISDDALWEEVKADLGLE